MVKELEKKKDTKESRIDVSKLSKELTALENIRAPYMPQWQEITEFIAPGSGMYYDTEPNQGVRKDWELLDPTPLYALDILAAGMVGGLTNPSTRWFSLETDDPELNKNQLVRSWCYDLTTLMMNVFIKSNFYKAIHKLFRECGAFGTAAMLIDPNPDTVIQCTTFTAGEFSISCNALGRCNAFGRRFYMTVQQLVDEFGVKNVPDSVVSQYEAGNRQVYRKVNHYIGENPDYMPSNPTRKTMRHMSVYWMDGQDSALRVDGYTEFPVIAPRWNVNGNDFYGSGPGWAALAESKTLQTMRNDSLIALQKTVDPPLIGTTDLRNQSVNDGPGEITYTDSDGLKPLYMMQFPLQQHMDAIMNSRDIINKAFFVDMFLTLLSDRDRTKTAREVDELHSEKMLMLGPVIENMDTEAIAPAIARTFGIMNRMGYVPPVPDELDGVELHPEYLSILAQAQRMTGLNPMDRAIMFAGQIAQFDPSVLDTVDPDMAIRTYYDMLGIPPSVMRSPDAVTDIRKAREQQMAQAQQMEAMQKSAAAANQGAQAMNSMSQAGASGGIQKMADQMGIPSPMGEGFGG